MRELAGEQDLAGVDDAPELATIEGHSRTLAQQTILGVGSLSVLATFSVGGVRENKQRSMTEVAQDASVETLPASLTFLALRFGIVALLIPIVWLWVGAAAGVATAVALASVLTLFAPRALVLDEEGFRQLSLVPRKKVLWRAVDSFKTGAAPKVGAFVLYTKAGHRPRWWYPAGWPAQGGLPPAFASARGGRALSARDLSDLLNDRLARARTASAI